MICSPLKRANIRKMTADKNMFCAIKKYTLTKHIKRIFNDTRIIKNTDLEYNRVEYSVNNNTGIQALWNFYSFEGAQ